MTYTQYYREAKVSLHLTHPSEVSICTYLHLPTILHFRKCQERSLPRQLQKCRMLREHPLTHFSGLQVEHMWRSKS